MATIAPERPETAFKSGYKGFLAFCEAIGEPLEPFQRRICRAAFSSARKVVAILPKGNYKTTTCALLGLHHLLTVDGAEVRIGAAMLSRRSRRAPCAPLSPRPFGRRGRRGTRAREPGTFATARETPTSRPRSGPMGLRAIYRRTLARGELAVNPCDGLQLPAKRGRRERFASPDEAERLIAALPVEDRPIWASAMYAGLRRGELIALRIGDVNLATGVIRVRRGWDDREGEIELKSNAGRRNVPIPSILQDFLTEHLARTRRAQVPMFSFEPRKLTRRADDAWEAAGLERITLHECRHTFASLMIAAGVNAKALSTFMGHANISITLDRYGHLMPGSEKEAAGMLDSYLTVQRERAEELARAAPRDNHGTTHTPVGDPRRPEATVQTA